MHTRNLNLILLISQWDGCVTNLERQISYGCYECEKSVIVKKVEDAGSRKKYAAAFRRLIFRMSVKNHGTRHGHVRHRIEEIFSTNQAFLIQSEC
jgi:hypothetical protein